MDNLCGKTLQEKNEMVISWLAQHFYIMLWKAEFWHILYFIFIMSPLAFAIYIPLLLGLILIYIFICFLFKRRFKNKYYCHSSCSAIDCWAWASFNWKQWNALPIFSIFNAVFLRDAAGLAIILNCYHS